jgi:Fibrobacter succinogenes major domain (Fib_succ_major)
MKTLVPIMIFILCIFQMSQAQNDSAITNKLYRAWLIPTHRGEGVEGVLYQVKDSSVVISNSLLRGDYLRGNYDVSEVNANKIKSIHIRRVGAQGVGVLAGGLTGAVIGIIVGLLQHTNHGTDADLHMQHVGMVVFPLLFTGMGVGIGAAAGGTKIKIPVGGSQAQYGLVRNKLDRYSLTYTSKGRFQRPSLFSKLRDSVIDIDGNVYHTLALGGQVWMEKNLISTRFRDGSAIQGISLSKAAGCQYPWNAVADDRKLCPAGWHIPTLGEWTSFFNSLGGEYGAFSGIEEGFSVIGRTGQWWSSTEQDANNALTLYLNPETGGVMFTAAAKSAGLSVRCIRDN